MKWWRNKAVQSEWRQCGSTAGTFQLHLQPLSQALLVEFVVTGRLHHHDLPDQFLTQTLLILPLLVYTQTVLDPCAPG